MGDVKVYGYERPRILEFAAAAGLEAAEVGALGRAGDAVHFVRPAPG